MSEHESSLSSFYLQLTQVQASISQEPTTELYQLENDLQEVIDLTLELIAGQYPKLDEPVWQVGDVCKAIRTDNGKYTSAVVKSINADGVHCKVQYESNNQVDKTLLSTLRTSDLTDPSSAPLSSKESRPITAEIKNHKPFMDKGKQDDATKRKEYVKKRMEKKKERFEKLEKACEADKNKWQAFKKKAIDRGKKKGVIKQSIFSTPKGPGGKVGVGTCGVSGKPMTEQQTMLTPAQRGVYSKPTRKN